MLKDYGIDGIYVVHAAQGYEQHGQRVVELFGKHGLDFEFVSEGTPATFGSGILQKYFTSNIKDTVSIGYISCTLNHILSYEKMVKRNNRYALVFEDDPFFIGDFAKKIQEVAKEADTLPPGFFISLENTTLEFPSTKKLKKGQLLYEANHGRCAGAFLIDQQAAKNILQDLQTNKCGEIIDWWHNTLIRRNVIKMYWAHPPLTEQGSHNGLLSTDMSSKNENTGRRIAWLVQKYYKMYIQRWFK
jgi:glycosyl transferase, family 25